MEIVFRLVGNRDGSSFKQPRFITSDQCGGLYISEWNKLTIIFTNTEKYKIIYVLLVNELKLHQRVFIIINILCSIAYE